jgi:ribosome recycling factor
VTEETLLDAVDKMERAIEHAQGQFASVRTGRANPALVEKLLVDYYGAPTPLQQLAGFQVPEARTLVVKPHDRGALAAIEKSIRESDLGLQPSNDGIVIRLSFPALTEERRKEYIKVARQKAEDARISVRNIRRHAKEAMEKMVKEHEVGEDDVKRGEKHLEDVTHKTVAHIDEILKHKEAELLEV